MSAAGVAPVGQFLFARVPADRPGRFETRCCRGCTRCWSSPSNRCRSAAFRGSSCSRGNSASGCSRPWPGAGGPGLSGFFGEPLVGGAIDDQGAVRADEFAAVLPSAVEPAAIVEAVFPRSGSTSKKRLERVHRVGRVAAVVEDEVAGGGDRPPGSLSCMASSAMSIRCMPQSVISPPPVVQRTQRQLKWERFGS